MDKLNLALGNIASAAGYGPGDLTTDLAAGTASVLPWVGAGVGGGVILLFAFMGIRKGFAFFRQIGK